MILYIGNTCTQPGNNIVASDCASAQLFKPNYSSPTIQAQLFKVEN